MSSLFDTVSLGGTVHLQNRITMGSMTRNRCVDNGKPGDEVVRLYATRAQDGAGLIIAEGIFTTFHGTDYPFAPMMFNQEHVQAWKAVTDAVHKEGGKIFFQPWHAGRVQNESMPLLKDNAHPVLAPSNIPAAGGKYRNLPGQPGHSQDITVIDDPKAIVDQFRHSVTLAKEAGFDGIELLSQGGYLLHNFLSSRSNTRTDSYGGNTQNRCRCTLEVLDAIIEIWGANRVGIKICPTDDLQDSAVSHAELTETYTYLISQLVHREIAFIDLSRRGAPGYETPNSPRPEGCELPDTIDVLEQFGGMIKYPGSRTKLMVNTGYTVSEAERLVTEGKIDLISFARAFIYNPDLVSRINAGVPLSQNDRGGWVYYGPYEPADEGYNDWPLSEELAKRG
ncbi:hypothetical protein BJY04DRAFT_229270 [Aspergillus karnatakaensis]|uniref:uncharacterized protein n=1 Tax=Aspergillus karnatakaensis TaxID=1810916 RepID=UPI003CCDB5F9